MRQRSRRTGRLYAAIPNAAMRDTSLSLEARGMLALLMTYADDWHFMADHLQEVAGIGRDKFRRVMAELERAGYVLREVIRGEGGHLAGTEWVILDDPAAPVSGGRDPVRPQDGGEQAQNTADHRPPENPVIGVTDPLKNRPPVEPTAGESAPIRKETDKKNNLKNPQPPEGAACGFEDFWKAYPRQVERQSAEQAWQALIRAGKDPQAIVAAAVRYARTDQVKRGYAKNPANWLRSGAWSDHLPPPADAALPDVARFWADKVRARAFIPASGISATVAHEMVGRGLVSPAELAAVGVQL